MQIIDEEIYYRLKIDCNLSLSMFNLKQTHYKWVQLYNVALGARIIEKYFILSRDLPSPDAAVNRL
jgi:sialic acid synthase SpsE